MKTCRRVALVAKNKRVAIERVPFRPGTTVEVIVRETGKNGRRKIAGIYDYTRELVKRKRLPRYNLREIERIIHESRGVGA